MCGIVGLISRRTNGFFGADVDLLENLLVLDTLRGMDSTGAFTVMQNKQIGAIKVASHPFHMYATQEWSNFRSKVINSGRIVVGHNRKATQGSINSDNAHPFIEDHIILVHNGSLTGHKALADREVDSHAVASAFATRGAEAVLPEINGAFAFVWWDAKEEKLFVVRNDERPLSLVVTDELFVLASEDWMPTSLLTRAKKKITEVININPGYLYEFSIRGTYSARKVKLKEAVPLSCAVNYKNNRWSNCDDLEDDMVFKENVPALLEKPKEKAFKIGEEVTLKLNTVLIEEGRNKSFCRIKAHGIVDEEGKPMLDVSAWLPSTVDISEAGEWTSEGAVVKGKIGTIVSSNCGDVVWVHDLRLLKKMNTWCDPVTVEDWEEIVDKCTCKKCNSSISYIEAPFTSVKVKRDGTIRITCADCIEKSLTGEIKNAFIKRRNTTIQNFFGNSQEIIERTLPRTKQNSSTIVH